MLVAIPTAEQIALVRQLLPTEASQSVDSGGYGWDSTYITVLMTENNYSPTQAVRYFWLQRVNETSEYLDISGKPLTEIHKQAKEMLDYWDNILLRFGITATGPRTGQQGLTFGEIELPDSYERVSRFYRFGQEEGSELDDSTFPIV